MRGKRAKLIRRVSMAIWTDPATKEQVHREFPNFKNFYRFAKDQYTRSLSR